MQKHQVKAHKASKALKSVVRILLLSLPTILLAKPLYAFAPLVGLGLGALGLAFLPLVVEGLLKILVAILGLVFSGIANLAIVIIEDAAIGGGRSLVYSDAVRQIWAMMLTGVNGLFFLGLCIFAVLIITGAQNYNLKKALTALIYGVAIANLSYDIVRIIFIIAQSLTRGISEAFSLLEGNGNKDIARELVTVDWLKLFSWPTDFTLSFASMDDMFRSIMISVIFLVSTMLGAYVLVKLGLALIERAIRITLAIVLAPLQFALQIFPGDLGGLGKAWWGDLIKWALVLPYAYLLLGISAFLMPNVGDITITHMVTDILYPQGDVTNPDAWAQLMLVIASIAVMVGAANAPAALKLESIANKFVGRHVDNAVGAGWKATKDWAKGGIRVGAQTIRARRQGVNLNTGSDTPWYNFGARAKENAEEFKKASDKNRLYKVLGGKKDLDEEYEQAKTAYIKKRAPLVFGNVPYEDLTDSQKSILENESAFQNTTVARRYNEQNAYLGRKAGEGAKSYEDKDYTLGQAKADFENQLKVRKTLTDQLANNPNNKKLQRQAQETDVKIMGLLRFLNRQAGRTGDTGNEAKIYLSELSKEQIETLEAAKIRPPKPENYNVSPSKRKEFMQRQLGVPARAYADLAAADQEERLQAREVEALSRSLNEDRAETFEAVKEFNRRITDQGVADAEQIKQFLTKAESRDDFLQALSEAGATTMKDIPQNALDSIYQKQTRSDITKLLNDTTLDDAARADRISSLLEASGVATDPADKLAEALIKSKGKILNHKVGLSEFLKAANNRALVDDGTGATAPAGEDVMKFVDRFTSRAQTSASLRTAQAKREAAILARDKAANQISTSDTDHPGYSGKIANYPGSQLELQNRLKPVIAAAASASNIQPDGSFDTEHDKTLLRDLIAAGRLNDTAVQEYAAINKAIDLTVGSQEAPDVDLSNPEQVIEKLTLKQFRNTSTHALSTSRDFTKPTKNKPAPEETDEGDI